MTLLLPQYCSFSLSLSPTLPPSSPLSLHPSLSPFPSLPSLPSSPPSLPLSLPPSSPSLPFPPSLASWVVQKGSGYHLDLLIVAILIFVHSLLGLPWVVGATIRSITHVQSLFIYSPCTAPGDRPKFLGVR